jgi:hypothetical protein
VIIAKVALLLIAIGMVALELAMDWGKLQGR